MRSNSLSWRRCLMRWWLVLSCITSHARRRSFRKSVACSSPVDAFLLSVFTEVNALPLDEEIAEHHVPIGSGVPSPI
jgi:hypothetical protein